MVQIPNWCRTATRNASDVTDRALAGTVREWTHAETGEMVAVRVYDEPENRRFYTIALDGEEDTSRSTLRAAEKEAVRLMREAPEGIEARWGDAR